MNPVNRVVAASDWSWRLLGGTERVIAERALFGQFARLAMAPARAASASASSNQFDHQAWIQEGLSLVAKAC